MEAPLTPEAVAERTGPTRILREYRVFTELDSTNTYLMERARGEGEKEGLVVVAEYQTAGRGRQGRSWVAPPGSSIHCSVLLRPPLPAGELYLLTAACALAVCDALAPLVQATPQLKWPNDVLLEGRKVCGVLTESVLSGAVRPLAVVGFGVNVLSVHGPLHAPNAGCVAMYSAYPVTILDVLGATLAAYDELLTDLYTRGGEGMWQAWRAGLTFGGRVQVRAETGTLEGVALDVQRDGALLVRGDDGVVRAVYAGEAVDRPSQSAG